MASITTINGGDLISDSRTDINNNFSNLNSDKAEVSGQTFTGQIDFSGTNHAGIKLISLTTVQRDNLTPANGMLVYNTDNNRIESYESGTWADASADVLAELGDVTITSVADNEVLAYDSGTSEWINQTPDEADLIDKTTSQTLTGKTIDPASNTIDGDKLEISWDPTNYTPDSSPTEADDVDDLTAHLKGIDNFLVSGGVVSGAANVGTGGVGVFKNELSGTLNFKNINAGSSKITVTDDTGDDEVDIDVAEANLTLDNLGGTLALTKGGTGQTTQTEAFDALSPTTTKGDIISTDGADNQRLGVGSDDQVLTADSTQALGVRWAGVPTGSKVEKTFTAGANISLGDAVVIGGINEASLASNLTDDSGEAYLNFTTIWAQTFTTASDTEAITKVTFKHSIASGSGVNNWEISLWADSGGVPTGSALATQSYAAPSRVGGTYTDTISFASPVSVSASTTYHIGIRLTGQNTGQVAQRLQSGGSGTRVYTSTDTGSSWSLVSTYPDMYFEVFDSNVEASSVYPANTTNNDNFANQFIGFSTEAITSGNTGKVTVSGIADVLSGLTVGSTYYLQDTDGQIGTSAGANSRKIGLSLSATEVLIKHDNV